MRRLIVAALLAAAPVTAQTYTEPQRGTDLRAD